MPVFTWNESYSNDSGVLGLTLDGTRFEIPLDNEELATMVVQLLNTAYEMGKSSAANAIHEKVLTLLLDIQKQQTYSD